ncbi:MAG: hypothetical protein ACJ8AT_27120 [Hyalangium sp.]|uniref:bestrophin-like domain n=1 Tax=Hyalangium sp. TaxID=2028555 RepID=UPI00389AB02D
MDLGSYSILVSASQTVIAIFLVGTSMLAAGLGYGARLLVRRRNRQVGRAESPPGQETYIVSQVLGLLSLLLAFTFGVALDRYEARRTFVSSEANAIGDEYTLAQMLDDPHRSRLAQLLKVYVDNRVELGSRTTRQEELLVANNRLLIDIARAVSDAMDTAQSRGIQVPLVNTTNSILDFDRSRKVARQTRVPPEVLQVLYIYLVVAAAILGFVLEERRSRFVAVVLFLLLTMSIITIVDLNRPTSGRIREPQMAMEMLQRTLATRPVTASNK